MFEGASSKIMLIFFGHYQGEGVVKKWCCFILLFCVLGVAMVASAAGIRVAVVDSPNQAGVSELANTIWHRLNAELNLYSSYQNYTDEHKALADLEAGQLDVVLGPVKAQPNLKGVVFLSSYITDGLAVFTSLEPTSLWLRIVPFLKVMVSGAVLTLLLLIFVVGSLVWLAERKKNQEFRRDPVSGIGDGVWFAIVSMTTVGYGDKTPKTFFGRLVTVIWLFVVLLLLSSIVALITAEITGSKLYNQQSLSITSLKGHPVAYLAQSESAKALAERYRLRPVPVQTMQEAMSKVEQRQVSAAILNAIDARYFLHRHPERGVVQTNLIFDAGRYAFAVKSNFKRIDRLDQAILLMEDTGELERLTQKVLGLGPGPLKQPLE